MSNRTKRRGTLHALVLLPALVACGENRADDLASTSDPLATAPALSNAPLAEPTDEAADAASVRAAYVATRQAEGANESRYHVGPPPDAPLTTSDGSVLVARNGDQSFTAELSQAGVRLLASDGSFEVALSTRGIRCGDEWVDLRTAPARVSGGSHRVELARSAGRAAVSEWYVNGPLGLEQGFTLNRSPCAQPEPELAVEMRLEGRSAVASTDGKAVVLAGEGLGTPGLRMRDLFVHDAAGRMLPARFEASADRIAIRVGLNGAVWPIQIDPLIVSQEAKLLTGGALHASINDNFGWSVAIADPLIAIGARGDFVSSSGQGSAYVFRRAGTSWLLDGWLVAQDAAQNDRFGSSIDVDATSVVVGAEDDDGAFTNQGSAYVFTYDGSAWTQQQKLTPSDPAQDDRFGHSVAVAGATLAVGAHSKTVSANLSQGAAYVFARSGTTWSQQAKVTASDGTSYDWLGSSVDLSGTTLVAGAFGAPGVTASPGAAYVYVRSGTSWPQQAKLTANDGANTDQLGRSVSIAGNTVVAGAPTADISANADQGAAYAFVRSGTTWSQQQKLTLGTAADRFGESVSVSANTLLVGAPQFDQANSNQGRAYAFTRSGTTWSPQSNLSVPFVTGKLPGVNDYFGNAVALEGDVAVVGAPYAGLDYSGQGVVAVYTRTSTKWDGGKLLTADDDAASVGARVAISGNTALLGAPNEPAGAKPSLGAAYVFLRTGTSWAKQARLLASDGAAMDQFGSAVALDGTTALVGAASATVAANADQGAAYAFVRTGTAWSQQQKLVASDGAASHAFGAAVGLDGSDAVVGAPGAGPTSSQGAAYVFVRAGSAWSQQQKLVAADAASTDRLDTSVAIDTNSVIAGVPYADAGAADRGAAYVFTRSGSAWTQQQKLVAADGAANHLFGKSADISGTSAVVGAPMTELIDNEAGSNAGNGAAYVFIRSGATWSQQVKLTASDGVFGDKLGDSVAIEGETVLAGASRRNNADRKGGAYLYLRSGTTWTQRSILVASDAGQLDRFGTAVAIGGPLLLVGAPGDDFSGHYNHGSGYVFLTQGLAGQPCGATDQCDANYFCIDGVCCTSACPGYCEVCSAALGAVADGTCTVKPANSTPDQPCAGNALCNGVSGNCPSGCTSDANCASGSYCSTAGTCLPSRANGQLCNPAQDCMTPGCKLCASGFCTDGVCCGTACNGGPCDRCDSPTAGTCSLIPKGGTPQSSCNGYMCNGSSAACSTTCATATDCESTHFCDAGNCVPKKPKGQDCTAQEQCQSGLFCSDGVCCSSACQGKCQACKAANKENGTASGDCEAAKKGSNPGGLCIKSTDPCGEQSSCSGTEGVCAVSAFGTACGPTTCNGTAVSGKVCDGTGTCIDQQNAECAPYLCQGGACTSPCTADVQCVTGNYCSGGFCVPKQGNGLACSAAKECTSSFCVDGVCCDSPCNAQCQACAEIGSVGTCKVVTGTPRPPRTDCAGSGTCKGQCDGANPTACTFPSTATQCQSGQCTGDVLQPAGNCDGTGACALPSTKNCAPYGCDSTAGSCKTTCTSTGDCSQGATCDTTTSQCTTASATCQDAYTVKLANGQSQSCSPYKCVGGACQQQCATSGDCAPGYSCSGTQCVADQDGGAGAAGSGGTGGGGTGGSATGGSTTGGGAGSGGTGGGNVDAGGAAGTAGGGASSSSDDGGGCGCRVPASRGSGTGALWLALLAISAAARRRRARAGGRSPAGLGRR